VQIITAYLSGRFGLFGLQKDPGDHAYLHDIGVGFCIISIIVFTLVKSDQKPIDSQVYSSVSVEQQPQSVSQPQPYDKNEAISLGEVDNRPLLKKDSIVKSGEKTTGAPSIFSFATKYDQLQNAEESEVRRAIQNKRLR